MKPFPSRLAAACALLLAVSPALADSDAAAVAAEAPASAASFEGRLLLADGQPAAGYTVTVVGRPSSAICDGDGRFVLTPVPTPPFSLVAIGPGGEVSAPMEIEDLPRGLEELTLPEVLRETYAIAAAHGLSVANVFHAGDGNLHPNLLFDERESGATARVLDAGAAIMRLCVDAGGSITGEHGVGLEKRDFIGWIFDEGDLAAMASLKRAFGAGERYNPCKAFPTRRGCGEVSSAHVQRVMSSAPGEIYV